ncbi:MAG TPA: glycoside hydrolase family 127 protein [Verrucomicrobiota bacterium]|nr:glycoside hydrolase family 127 protein [Verrucomicrobiota bacterium]
MKPRLLFTALLLATLPAFAAESVPAALEPVRLQDIRIHGFWKQQAKRLTEHWLPHCIRQMEQGGRGQEYLNLQALARVQQGEQPEWKYTGAPWSDAYVYNTVEAVCLALAIQPEGDAELARAQARLRAKLEEWIPTILAAQSPDGYIHSFHTLRQQPRYTQGGDHEFYVMGYFLEMGVAHYRMTGGKDRRLYNAAVKCGDHLWSVFGPPPKRTWRNGHPGLEYALCRLGRLVNEVEGAGRGDQYIQLARHFLDHQHEGGQPDEYNQSDMPAVQLSEAKGHAVRGAYFYTAMTDIALHQGNAPYQQAADRLWTNAIHRKHYLTGGVGASHHGEAFAGDYELPHEGYCESCAGCGLSFWADRMHRLHADGHYRDVQERALYNNILGAVELSGTNFYYQNPLDEKRARYPWHGCPCCVGNIPRALFAIKDLIYSVNPARTELYLSHYVDSEAALPEIGGAPLRIRQATRYPWDGQVTVTLHPARTTAFTLKLRIPDRTESELYSATPDLGGRFAVRLNGQPQAPKLEQGYIALRAEWKDGDRVELSLPMAIQHVTADARVAANVGRVALQYGPLVYNVESVDLPPGKPLHALALAAEAPLRAEWDDALLGGVLAIRGAFADGTPLQAIPNFTRMNRLPQHQSQWIHLANTYDGVTQRVYVDGRLAKSRQPGSLDLADTRLTLGSDPFGQNRHFKGAIAKPAIFDAALDAASVARLAAARPDTAALGVERKPLFAGTHYTLDGLAPVVTPHHIGIAGNAPWTMSVWIKADAGAASPDDFGLGILGWGRSSRNAGNFLYYRPEGETVFGFYSNDDRAPTGESTATRSIVWLPESRKS